LFASFEKKFNFYLKKSFFTSTHLFLIEVNEIYNTEGTPGQYKELKDQELEETEETDDDYKDASLEEMIKEIKEKVKWLKIHFENKPLGKEYEKQKKHFHSLTF
jgi:hypothetical protein